MAGGSQRRYRLDDYSGYAVPFLGRVFLPSFSSIASTTKCM